MITQIIGIKDFRQNLAQLAKKAKRDSVSFLVTNHNKPLFEVNPCLNEKPETDDTQISYYKTVEQNLEFWNDKADDDIFKS